MHLHPTQQEIIRRTVQETLGGLGFDLNEPKELQADMYYLRRVRQGSEEMQKTIRRATLTLVVSTGLYLLWESVKQFMHK